MHDRLLKIPAVQLLKMRKILLPSILLNNTGPSIRNARLHCYQARKSAPRPQKTGFKQCAPPGTY
ncbi:hypothetical protein SAMN05216302_102419 [Nitrosomonas aestuarii]|uniref:Uncharacterized protein n=1 Tax=Nitrosomonas aestuarii TaxID=52441 RepID=A0A1I4DXE6_9PROT|nr:hypothetical protein SAMN05216302_102419 [Nitrosomonas aestuarii]